MEYQQLVNTHMHPGKLLGPNEYTRDTTMVFVSNDSRGQTRGSTVPYHTTGVHSVPALLREENALRYRDIWRANQHAPDRDPGNVSSAARENMAAVLLDRATIAEAMRSEPAIKKDAPGDGTDAHNAATGSSYSCYLNISIVASVISHVWITVSGIWRDLYQWDTLPGESTWGKLERVMCRDQRAKYLIIIMLPIFLLILGLQLSR